MATSKNYIRETSKDFNSITEDILSSIINITEEWVPADETDPGLVYTKVAAMLGDMLSYNRDRGTQSMFPDTVQERQDAYKLFKSLGYYMKWYRSAKCIANISINNAQRSNTYIIPKFTVFKTKTTGIKYTYCGSQLSTTISDNTTLSISSAIFRNIELVQGEAVTPPIVTTYKIPIGEGKKWHDSYGYNISVSDVKSDIYINLSNNKIDQDNIVLIDSKGEEWEKVDNLSQVESGKYYELYINSYNSAFLKLSQKPSDLGITGFKLFYILTDGASGRITANALNGYPLTPVYHKSSDNGPTYEVYNNNVSISNGASEGGYDMETAEEARYQFNKLGSNLTTLVTLEDFEKDVKTVEGVDQCVAYDIDKYSESCTEYLFDYEDKTATYRRRVYLTGDLFSGAWKERFGDCSLWMSSIRIYRENNLVWSGVVDSNETPSSPYTKKYYLVDKYDGESTGQRTIADTDHICLYLGEETDAQGNKKPFFELYFQQSTTEEQYADYGNYWIEYMICRDAQKIGINLLTNFDKSSTIGNDKIIENVNAEIDQKKHIYFSPYIYSKPYIINWMPEGKLYTPQISLEEAKNMLTKTDLYLQEKYKNSVMEYGAQLDRSDVESSIKDITSYYLIESGNISYSVPIYQTIDELIDGVYVNEGVSADNILYYTPEKLDISTLSKNITITKTLSASGLTKIESGDNTYYKAKILLGENFVIVPGTVEINIDYGNIIITDQKSKWDEGSESARDQVEDKTNNGLLISSSPYYQENRSGFNDNIIFYDTIGRVDEGLNEKGKFYNLAFMLNEGYISDEPINVQITFDTNWDFLCEYGGYDPNKLYIAPASIRRDNL